MMRENTDQTSSKTEVTGHGGPASLRNGDEGAIIANSLVFHFIVSVNGNFFN